MLGKQNQEPIQRVVRVADTEKWLSHGFVSQESRQRIDALGRVILRTVDELADPIGQHLFCRVRSQQLHQLLSIVAPWIKPQVVLALRDDDRHSLMDGLHQVVGVRGQDRAGFDGLLTLFPALPQARQAKRPVAFQPDEVGQLVTVGCLPFVEAISDNEAPPGTKSTTKRRLHCDRFRAGVGLAVAVGRIIGPRRNQTPPEKSEFRLLCNLTHDGHWLRWGDVVLRLQRRDIEQAELLGNCIRSSTSNKPTTHEKSLLWKLFLLFYHWAFYPGTSVDRKCTRTHNRLHSACSCTVRPSLFLWLPGLFRTCLWFRGYCSGLVC